MKVLSGPIGVFDSGVGGLTVLAALRARLPREEFLYLGDTARLPYGSKSAQTVERYSLQCARRLLERGIRALVIACNTASASALPALRQAFPSLPVFGVIEPGAMAAVRATRSAHVAVIATPATVAGRAYEQAIAQLDARVRVQALACGLFVSLAEEGWTDGPEAQAVARRYLAPLFAADDSPDVLVLGCTHFPLLLPVIRRVVPARVAIVDSAATTAELVSNRLPREGGEAGTGRVRWLATDGAGRFADIGSRFLGEPIDAAEVEVVDL
ncbi:MAG: glutamate racemase [Steroidobacteraceae bacterium]